MRAEAIRESTLGDPVQGADISRVANESQIAQAVRVTDATHVAHAFGLRLDEMIEAIPDGS